MDAFHAYALLLMISGGLLVVMAGALSGPSKASRVINLLVGLAFFGYGFYLEFLFGGGHYYIFFYAFILPVLLIVNTFKARKAANEARQHAAQQAYAQQAYAQQQPAQAQQGQPQYGPPPAPPSVSQYGPPPAPPPAPQYGPPPAPPTGPQYGPPAR